MVGRNQVWSAVVALSFGVVLGMATNDVFSQSEPPGGYLVPCSMSGPAACSKSDQDCVNQNKAFCAKYRPPGSEFSRCRCE